MLEVTNLTKVYKPKKGVPVVALDKVSLKFPEKGMVFLLGKSGSGKSTLLNLLGGLDKYDGGEIIIKGESSKSFSQKYFDSYRNTYVGFIFQEYNLLNEFTVGANIALAIELQGRKATDKEVNDILAEVDLQGFGNRKPNELSGGQKQRVAIARALIKKPQIIMADEPTGALDSNTGKQIFDTLKKLSQQKLVIIVSHDREFAELYADRIIELSDGKVISDVELDSTLSEKTMDTISYTGNVIKLPKAYHITEQDRKAINDYILSLSESEVSLEIAAKSTKATHFIPTDEGKIVYTDTNAFRLIKSKLPLKNAFKIGCSSLKYKKFRLIVTIFLSVISFALFGLADTFAAYDHVNTCTNSIMDTEIGYLSVAKSQQVGDEGFEYWRDGLPLSNKDIKEIEKETGVKMQGVYIPTGADLNFEYLVDVSKIRDEEAYFSLYNATFNGFSPISNEILNEMDYKLLKGNLPQQDNEIAISEYIFEIFKKGGYLNFNKNSEKNEYQNINTYSDILGKTIMLNNIDYTVTAVIDTGLNLERYAELAEASEHKDEAEVLIDYVLFSEFDFSTRYSYSGLAMLSENAYNSLVENGQPKYLPDNGYIYFYSDTHYIYADYITKLSDVKENIIWFDGEKTELKENEIILTGDCIDTSQLEIVEESINYANFLTDRKLNGEGYFDDSNEGFDYDFQIVGIIDSAVSKSNLTSTAVIPDGLFNKLIGNLDDVYAFAVGAMPKARSDIKNTVDFCYNYSDDVRFTINNSVTYELDIVNEVLNVLSEVFVYIGIGFALFAAIMLSNFIAISITHKKQEIGILRAIGSRSLDVFKIFFAESFVIAMINFVIASVGVGVITAVVNGVLRNEVGFLVTILGFGARQVVLLFAISILVAFIASFIPVKKIASKKPIDAINNR